MNALDHMPATHAIGWRQPLPRSRPVDREQALVELSHGRRVVHVGFVDYPVLHARVASGDWLHSRLASAASSLVGIDSSADGVEWARAHGYESYVADAQSAEEIAGLGVEPADVIVAGEVIEHLDAPGPFLRAMLALVKPDGRLVLTTPNTYRIVNFFVVLAGIEFVHPDHTAWHSPNTLRTLGERNGWRVERIGYYQNPPLELRPGGGLTRSVAVLGVNALRRLGTAGGVVPHWSDGLIAVYRTAESPR